MIYSVAQVRHTAPGWTIWETRRTPEGFIRPHPSR